MALPRRHLFVVRADDAESIHAGDVGPIRRKVDLEPIPSTEPFPEPEQAPSEPAPETEPAPEREPEKVPA